ncbi:MAG: DNA polymerase I [Micrococcales bacterium]
MTDNRKPTLLLIDGHSLAFRAFYALSPDSFRAPSGQHTNAVHGFISMLLNILGAEKPTHLAVAFDLSRESFRTAEYPAYKGTRGETPPEFNGQTELLHETLSAMNIRTFTRENYEADDILASFADQAADAGFRVLLVSGDRDTFQLIRPETTILYPVKGVLNLARMDDAAVFEKYGVHAKQYPDLAALVGETSDNLIGVPSVGPKTAAKWITEYGSLDGILANAHLIGGKVGEQLREHQQNAVRNRRLNHLVRDLDLGVNFDELQLGPVNEEKVREVFARLGFRSLTERVLKLKGSSSQNSTEDVDSPAEESVFEELVRPEIKVLDEPALESWLQSQPEAISICVANEFAAFNGRELVSSSSIPSLWLASSARKIVFDSKNLRRKLLGLEIDFQGVVSDPLLECYLIDPLRRDYSVQKIATDLLGFNPREGEAFVAADLAWLAWLLHKNLAPKLSSTGQEKVFEDIELPTSKTLAEMEFLGIKVDGSRLEKLSVELAERISEVQDDAFKIIGKEINLSSPKQLQTVLFEELGMTGTKSVKTGFSTNAEALTTLFEQTGHPFLERLLEHREVTKMRQMVEIILKGIGSDGRVHTSYVQTGTSTGRLSSENPNLQNIPIKSEIGKTIRDCFEVGSGFETLLTADYSQIEMRIMAHLSGDEGLIEAFNAGEDLHRFVGARVFGVSPEEVTPAMRSKVKAMSYGLVYGLSEYGLAKQLKISNSEAKQLMSDYFARFGGVRTYLGSVVDGAKLNGYTVTTFGRRRPFDELKSPIFQIRENARRAALNAPIQGTAADIMKLAMNNIESAMRLERLKSRMLLQVHDELVFEVSPGELDQLRELVVHQMQNVVKLSVPLEVHVGIGKTWETAGH